MVNPIFSIDLNNDGEPDLQQIKKWSVMFCNTKIPLGLLSYNIIIIFVKLMILLIFIKLLIKYVHLY